MGLRYLFVALMLPFLPFRASAPAAPAPAPSVAPSVTPTPVVSSEPVVQTAVDLLRSEEAIARAEILYFPVENESPIAVTPELLERGYYEYRIEIRYFDQAKLRGELADALAMSVIRPTTEQGDLRWGCILYDWEGRRVLTMYFDRDGRFGFINGVPMRGCGQAVQTLKLRCAPLWQ